MTITRRTFLGAAGGAGLTGIAGLNLLVRPPREFQEDRSAWPALQESWVPSVCRACPAGCGIRGRIVDGNVVRIEGNPLHPVSRGGLCPKGIASVQATYDPDRPLHCGVRVAELREGSPTETLTPDEALDLLAERVKQALETRGPDGVAIVSGTGPTATSLLLNGLARSLGQAGSLAWDPDMGLKLAVKDAQGLLARPVYDVAQADTVLVFGSGFLEDDASPVRRALDLADLRRRPEGRRTRFFAIEPRYSLSAARADRWLPIRPGTYGTLALGVAYVILKDNRQAATFLRDWTESFEDLTLPDGSSIRGYRRLVLEEGRPETVANITGVPVETILEVGNLFASSHRSLAIPTREATWHHNGVRNAALVHALNALVGNLESSGGAFLPSRLPLSPDPDRGEQPEGPSAGEGNAEAYLLDVAEGRQEPPSLLILAEAEPEEWPGAGRAWREVRERTPMVVTIANRRGPSVRAADLVLPAATHHESWDLWCGQSPLGPPLLGMSVPLIPGPKDVRPTGEWVLALARKLEPRATKALPWNDIQEHLQYRLQGIFEAKRGMAFSDVLEEDHQRQLEARGWWAPTATDFSSWSRQLHQSGGWWDPFHPKGQYGRVLRTPSGRFRFPTEIRPQSDQLQVPAAQSEAGAQLRLHLFPVLAFTGGGGAELPWLQQGADSFHRISWSFWIELHPDTAASLGIDDQQEVEVGNRRGSFRAVARVFEGAMPGLVNVPMGFSPLSGGRYARNRGGHVSPLLGRARDPVSGMACLSSTPVWVRPA